MRHAQLSKQLRNAERACRADNDPKTCNRACSWASNLWNAHTAAFGVHTWDRFHHRQQVLGVCPCFCAFWNLLCLETTHQYESSTGSSCVLSRIPSKIQFLNLGLIPLRHSTPMGNKNTKIKCSCSTIEFLNLGNHPIRLLRKLFHCCCSGVRGPCDPNTSRRVDTPTLIRPLFTGFQRCRKATVKAQCPFAIWGKPHECGCRFGGGMQCLLSAATNCPVPRSPVTPASTVGARCLPSLNHVGLAGLEGRAG